MKKTLRFKTLLVVMFVVTSFTISTKAQKGGTIQSSTTTTVAVNTQDIEPDVTNEEMLQWNIAYYPKLLQNFDQSKIKATLAEILQKAEVIDLKSNLKGVPKKVTVIDDGVEVKINKDLLTIKLSDLALDLSLGLKEAASNDPSCSIYKKSLKSKINYLISAKKGKNFRVYFTDYRLQFNKNISFNFDDSYIENAKKLADQLYTIQHTINQKNYKADLAKFEPIAASYRALKVKPPVSEDQRKYIVQANSFNKLKEFSKAAELYNKALEVDATSYPAAYLNIALLTAQKHKLDQAIFYMKKFLMLEPDSPDARSAQDKIYEWEGLM